MNTALKKHLATYLTTKQAAAELGIIPDSVKIYCANGVIDGLKVGRSWMISPAAIKAYRKQHHSKGRPKRCRGEKLKGA